MWCWGWNGYGQLGIGNHTDQDRPRQVTTPARGRWASVTARGIHTCATRAGGTLWCWGDNTYGQLGIGYGNDQDRPRQVSGCMQPRGQTLRVRASPSWQPAGRHPGSVRPPV